MPCLIAVPNVLVIAISGASLSAAQDPSPREWILFTSTSDGDLIWPTGLLPTTGANLPEQVLDVFERLARDLRVTTHSATLISLALEAVRQGTKADLVYWYNADLHTADTVCGPAKLPSHWCEFFGRTLVKRAAGKPYVLWNDVNESGRGAGPQATSAAGVQISKAHGTWMIAVHFDRAITAGSATIRFMALTRRLYRNQRQQLQICDRFKDTLFGSIRCLTATIDAKDPYTCGHSERVARIGKRLAKQMNLPRALGSDVYLAGLLHDVGKIGIRESVLRKAGALSAEEFAHIQEHPVIGDRIVSMIPAFEHLRPGVRNHHESYNGKGYPDQLAGEAIPLLARILAVADSCDAMMSARPYRPALPYEQLDRTLADGAGIQWDPAVIAAYFDCREDLHSICQRGLGVSVLSALELAIATGQMDLAPRLSASAIRMTQSLPLETNC